MRKVFLFDLDSTITQEEILPTIAGELGMGSEMQALTESTMMGEIPFRDSFTARVDMLKDIPVKEVAKRIEKIHLNEKLVSFMKNNHDNCFVVTSNLDVWIVDLLKKIGFQDNVYCSSADVFSDKIVGVRNIFNKEDAVNNYEKDLVIGIGDGNNDYEMLKRADIGIAFGGVRNVAPSLLEVCDYVVYDESILCELLRRIKDYDL